MIRIVLDTMSGNLLGLDDKFAREAAAEVSYTKEEIDVKIAAVLKIRGIKATQAELPTSGNTRGDVWAVTEDNLEFVWLHDQSTVDATHKWEQLGPMHDMSAYYTKAQINAMLGTIPSGKTIMDLIGEVPDGKSLATLISELSARTTSAETELSLLDTRMSSVESSINSHDSRISNNESEITALDTRMTSAEGSITSLGNRTTAAEGNITSLGSRMTTAEGSITSQGNRLTAAEGSVTSHGTRLTTAEGSITSIQERNTHADKKIAELFRRIGDGEFKRPEEETFLEDKFYYSRNSDGEYTQLQWGQDYNFGDPIPENVYDRAAWDNISNRLKNDESLIAGNTDAVQNLDSRVTTNEDNITSQGTRLTTAEGTITSHGTRLTSAESSITSQGTRLTTAESSITDHGSRLTTAEGSIASQGTRLTTAESDIDDLDERVEDLEESEPVVYHKPREIQDYLFEIEYTDEVNYAAALEYFNTHVGPVQGGCTSIRKNNLIGRNFDWLYNDKAEFVIRVRALAMNEDGRLRHASIGTAGNVNALTNTFVKSGKYSKMYGLLPFITFDGINDAGVYVASHVVPSGDYGRTTGTKPGATTTLCNYMIPRYVLDNFGSAAAAVADLRDNVNIYCARKDTSGNTEECAYFIADATNTYVVEFVNNTVKVVDISDYPWEANFYRYNTEPFEGHMDYEVSGITDHGMGVERWNIASDGYASVTNASTMMSLLTSLHYTNAYTRETDKWYSEYVGGNLRLFDIIAAPDKFDEPMLEWKTKYLNRSRNESDPNFGTWQSNHSAVYDIQAKTIWIVNQQNTLDKSVTKLLIESTGEVIDQTARNSIASLEYAQRVLPSSTQTFGTNATYSACTDTTFRRYHAYYKRTGAGTTESPYVYTPLTLGTNYFFGELVCGGVSLYERTGGNTHTYQSDMTATFLANKIYSWYDKNNKMYIYLTAVASDPGFYEYVPGVTKFGDKPYEVYLEDPYVYTLSSDTSVNGAKTYCLRSGSGTPEDPYEYEVLKLTAGRDFNLFVKDGYTYQSVINVVNTLIPPHRQTT